MKLVAVGLIALSASACSYSFGLSGLDEDEPKSTGAIATRAVTHLSADLDEEDWRRAKAALAVALDPQGPGTQVSWDNPASTRKGTFTPTGAPFVKDDEICRDFSRPSQQSLRIRPAGHGLPPLRRRVGDQGHQADEGRCQSLGLAKRALQTGNTLPI